MAVVAAELALQILADVLKTKRAPEVGIGLGPGRATLDLCRTFSSLQAGYSEPVKLKLVAISAGCQGVGRVLPRESVYGVTPKAGLANFTPLRTAWSTMSAT